MTAASQALQLVELQCEALTNPMCVDERVPLLSWRVDGEGHGRKQSAYRIVVDTDRDRIARGQGGTWDSGRVASDATLHVPYGEDARAANALLVERRGVG